MFDALTAAGYTIEITTIIAFGLLILFAILGYTKKMSVGIAIISGIGGFVIAYIFSPYSVLIIHPLANSIWYGYAWTVSSFIGLFHIASTFLLVVMAGYNLYESKGEIAWA